MKVDGDYVANEQVEAIDSEQETGQEEKDTKLFNVAKIQVKGEDMTACLVCGELVSFKVGITRHFKEQMTKGEQHHIGVSPQNLLWGLAPLFPSSSNWQQLYSDKVLEIPKQWKNQTSTCFVSEDLSKPFDEFLKEIECSSLTYGLM